LASPGKMKKEKSVREQAHPAGVGFEQPHFRNKYEKHD
jgi:hypothetical protein